MCVLSVATKFWSFSPREGQASSSEGEEKKPGTSASAAENLPEMSADSKKMFHTIIFYEW